MARASYEAMFRIDVRPILPTLTVPTLVIHGRKDPTPVQYGRYLADHIPGVQYLEVEGNSFASANQGPSGDSSVGMENRRLPHVRSAVGDHSRRRGVTCSHQLMVSPSVAI
jgi:hypothetical protein